MKLKQRSSGGPYYVHFVGPGGERKRISTETADETAAQLRALEIVRSHLLDQLPPDAATAHAQLETLGGLLGEAWRRKWRSQKGADSKRKLIGKIGREIGSWPLSMVTFNRIEAWLDGLTTGKVDPKPLSNATKNRYVSCIHTAIEDYARRNPTAGVAVPKLPHWPEDNVKERYLTTEEESRTLAWFADHVAPGDEEGKYLEALFLVLLDTGMRASEALVEMQSSSLLQRPNGGHAVHLKHGSTKSGRGRVVPLTSRAYAGVLFMLSSSLHGRWNSNQAGKRFSTVMAKAGIDGVTLHTLRHSCASRLVQRGVDLYKVMTWLGHSSMVITQRYAHFEPDSLTAALAALETAPVSDVPRDPVPYPGSEAHPPSVGTLSRPKLFAIK